MNKNTFEEKIYAFGGMDIEKEICYIFEALSYLNDDIRDKIINEVFFISTTKINAITYPLNSKPLNKYKNIIIFDTELFNQNKGKIIFVILHEIAHVILKHGCKGKYDNKETEANNLVKEWLK